MFELVLGERYIFDNLYMYTLFTVISISHLWYLNYLESKSVFLLLFYHMFILKTPTQNQHCFLFPFCKDDYKILIDDLISFKELCGYLLHNSLTTFESQDRMCYEFQWNLPIFYLIFISIFGNNSCNFKS